MIESPSQVNGVLKVFFQETAQLRGSVWNSCASEKRTLEAFGLKVTTDCVDGGSWNGRKTLMFAMLFKTCCEVKTGLNAHNGGIPCRRASFYSPRYLELEKWKMSLNFHDKTVKPISVSLGVLRKKNVDVFSNRSSHYITCRSPAVGKAESNITDRMTDIDCLDDKLYYVQ